MSSRLLVQAHQLIDQQLEARQCCLLKRGLFVGMLAFPDANAKSRANARPGAHVAQGSTATTCCSGRAPPVPPGTPAVLTSTRAFFPGLPGQSRRLRPAGRRRGQPTVLAGDVTQQAPPTPGTSSLLLQKRSGNSDEAAQKDEFHFVLAYNITAHSTND